MPIQLIKCINTPSSSCTAFLQTELCSTLSAMVGLTSPDAPASHRVRIGHRISKECWWVSTACHLPDTSILCLCSFQRFVWIYEIMLKSYIASIEALQKVSQLKEDIGDVSQHYPTALSVCDSFLVLVCSIVPWSSQVGES